MGNSKSPFITIVIVVAITVFLIGIIVLLNNNNPNQGNFGIPNLTEITAALELDNDQLTQCLEEGKAFIAVNDDLASGEAAGVTGTPGNFLVNNTTGLAIFAGGAYPLESMKASVAKLLDENAAEGDIAWADETSGVELVVAKVSNLVPVSESDHVRGNVGTPISLIEYSDLDCPYCARFHPTAAQLVIDDQENVNWVFRHFPLRRTHATAQKKAEATECAFEQGGIEPFWRMIDAFYSSQEN